MKAERRSPEQTAKEIQILAGFTFLSHAKELIRNHSGMETKILYGKEVYPEGKFQTEEKTIEFGGEERTFQVEATFDKRPSSLSAHLVNVSLIEVGKDPITVEQDPNEHQYVKANEATLPSLKDLEHGKKILEKLRTHFTHPSSR